MKIQKKLKTLPFSFEQLEAKHAKAVQKQQYHSKSKKDGYPDAFFSPSPPPLPPPLPHKFVILDCSAMNFLDYVGVTGLASVLAEFRSIGVVILLSHCKAAMREMISGSGAADSIPSHAIFISNHDAVLYCLSESQSGERVPLLSTSGRDSKATPKSEKLVDSAEDPEEIVSVVDETDIYVVDVGRLKNGETKGFADNDGEITKL